MNEEIQYGQPLYKVLASEKVIPILFTSMFRIGEETGELSEMEINWLIFMRMKLKHL